MINLRQKRLWYLLSKFFLVVNLIVFAILLPEVRLETFGIAFCFVAYTALHLWDQRNAEWTLRSVIVRVVISLGISLSYAILFEVYGFIVVIFPECLISYVIGKYYGK